MTKLDHPTDCAGFCGYVLEPGKDSFYIGIGKRGPYCLACWNKPRADLPSWGLHNAMAASALVSP